MVDNDKRDSLINDIESLVARKTYRQPRYDSYTANRVVDKLLTKLGILAIIGLLGYIIIKDSVRNKQYRCD